MACGGIPVRAQEVGPTEVVGGSEVMERLLSQLGGFSGSRSFAVQPVQRLIFNISNLLCPAAVQTG